MKKTLLSLTLLFASLVVAHAQWTTSGSNVYTTTPANNVIIGGTTPITVNASAGLFPSIISKLNIVTGQSVAPFADLVTLSHASLTADAVQRQIGFVFKLSGEGNVGESDKMGGMILESSNAWANYPSFSLVTANTRRLTIDNFGNVGIGITSPQNKLDVNGTVHAKKVLIDLNGWSDYVFKKDYALPSLTEVKNYIDANQHLPEIPSEQEIVKDGLNLGEMNKLLMKKVEELTLYAIENERMDRARDQQAAAKDKLLASLQQQINELKGKQTHHPRKK